MRILESDLLRSFEWLGDADDEQTPDLTDIPLVRHPFLVTIMDSDSYLLLEHSRCLSRLAEAGLAHVPVQVCPAEDVHLVSGDVGVTGFGPDDLTRLSSRHPDQVIVDWDKDDEDSRPGFLPIRILFADSRRAIVHLRHSSRTGCPPPLDYLFRSVLEKGRYLPAPDVAAKPRAVTRAAAFSARFSLPAFSLDDLRSAVASDRLFPPGIVKATAPCRILDIDFPTSVLSARIPSNEKDAFLRELIMFREQARRTTYYEGRVYLLNR